MIAWLKCLIPNRPLPVTVLSGPFRGARLILNPRNSMRKILGVYERELNPWLTSALLRVRRVMDVGGNDGYFTIGCATALRRLHGRGEIIAIEPEAVAFRLLESIAEPYRGSRILIRTICKLAGNCIGEQTIRLDDVKWQNDEPKVQSAVLVKIDVEGAEEDVLDGAAALIVPGNLFVIEVHREAFIKTITNRFSQHGLRLKLINQRPLPILGRELRSRENFWLVSDLDQTANFTQS